MINLSQLFKPSSVNPMLNSDTITCSSCAREWDGNAQCPCWINGGLDDVLDLSLPTEDTLSWHHLSKEQVIKGIILQICEGRLPHVIIPLIWRELKLSQKTDEDLQRSYYDQGIRLFTMSPRIIPEDRGLEWQIMDLQQLNGGNIRYGQPRCNPKERLLVTIRMIGDDNFLYEKMRVPIDPDNPLGPCQISYGPASLKSKIKYMKDQEYNYYDILSFYNGFMVGIIQCLHITSPTHIT